MQYLDEAVKHHVKKIWHLANIAPYLSLNGRVHLQHNMNIWLLQNEKTILSTLPTTITIPTINMSTMYYWLYYL